MSKDCKFDLSNINAESTIKMGRPVLPKGVRMDDLIPSIRCTTDQRVAFNMLGGAKWLRETIDSLKKTV